MTETTAPTAPTAPGATMTTKVSDEEVADTVARAEALIQAARYEMDRTATLLKRFNVDPRVVHARLTDEDHAEVQRLFEDGRRQMEADVTAARLAMTQQASGSGYGKKSRPLRNLV